MEPEAAREVFRGRIIRVAVESWPGREREVVHHPGACGIVAFTSVGDVLLVRQTREAIRGELLEIPAGIFDVEGEDGAACAARELLEETGHRVTHLQRLGSFFTSAGFTDERYELFLADAVREADVEEEGIELVEVPFVAALSAVHDGRIQDAKTALALLLARVAQEERARPISPTSASG